MHSSFNAPACSWAFSITAPSAHAKLLLVAVAAHADQDGLSKVSITRLAEMTDMSLRGVHNVLAQLERARLIAGERVPGIVTAYRIKWRGTAKEMETPAPDAGVVVGTPAPDAGVVVGTPAPDAGVVVGTPAPDAGVRARVDSESQREKERKEVSKSSDSSPLRYEESETPLPPTEIPTAAQLAKAEIGGRMRDIWNAVVKPFPHFAQSKWLTPKLLNLAVERFQHEFNRSFEQWEAYCRRLTRNAWLRGERPDDRSWRPSIEWAIQADTVLKEAEGRYPPDPEPKPQVVQPMHDVDPTQDPIWGKPNRIKLEIALAMQRPVIDDAKLQELSRDYKAALVEARAAQAALSGAVAHV
jgi:hypothetical protein